MVVIRDNYFSIRYYIYLIYQFICIEKNFETHFKNITSVFQWMSVTDIFKIKLISIRVFLISNSILD